MQEESETRIIITMEPPGFQFSKEGGGAAWLKSISFLTTSKVTHNGT